MSLILDALRKMEQDRNNRRGAAQNIRPEVLRYRGATKPQPTRPYLPVALGVALLACGVGAGLFLKGNREGSKEVATASIATTTQVAPLAPASPTAPAMPVVPVAPVTAPPAGLGPVGSTSAGPVSAGMLPTGAAPAVAMPAGKRLRRADTAKTAGSGAVANPDAAALPVSTDFDGARPRKPARREAAVAAQSPGDISISGIAWQDERRMRRAVLNGSLVGEGAEVAGARVLEIREDRVRLSRGGQVFEVPLSSSFSSR